MQTLNLRPIGPWVCLLPSVCAHHPPNFQQHAGVLIKEAARIGTPQRPEVQKVWVAVTARGGRGTARA